MSAVPPSDFAEGRAHYDQAIALYDPAAHRPLAMRFGQDIGVTILSYRSQALWMLGYPDVALADADHVRPEDWRQLSRELRNPLVVIVTSLQSIAASHRTGRRREKAVVDVEPFDTQALHAKLDELLRVSGDARNELTNLGLAELCGGHVRLDDGFRLGCAQMSAALGAD
jgi:hypothetical protein